ncbi:aspartic peptidase domain-containing protein [Aspergillus tetrazonus]
MGRLACYVGLWTTVLLSASAASERSIPVVKRDDPAVVSARLHAPPAPAIPALQARDTISAPALKDSGGYWLNVSIGTPPQPVALLVDAQDTGIVVMYPGSQNVDCSDYRYCDFYGQFAPQNSSSFASYDEDWQQELPTSFSGFDTLRVGDSKPINISLGLVAVDNVSSYSSIGVGPSNTSFPYQLVDRGLINTPSFSAWRDAVQDADPDLEQDPNHSPGSILFGGINAAKFIGPLHAFSFRDSLPSMTLPVHGVQIHVDPAAGLPSTANFSSTEVLINSTFKETLFDLQTRYVSTYVPLETAMIIYNALNLTTNRRDDGYYTAPEIPCSRKTENHTLTFLIGSAAFDIPWTAFLHPSNIPSQGICYFYIQPPYEEDPLFAGTLGSTLLSQLYLAVDYNNMMVGIAPINRNPAQDEILEIGTEAPQFPGGVGDFPETVTAYTPAPTETIATETSDGWAAMRTAAPCVLPAVAGAVLIGLI